MSTMTSSEMLKLLKGLQEQVEEQAKKNDALQKELEAEKAKKNVENPFPRMWIVQDAGKHYVYAFLRRSRSCSISSDDMSESSRRHLTSSALDPPNTRWVISLRISLFVFCFPTTDEYTNVLPS